MKMNYKLALLSLQVLFSFGLEPGHIKSIRTSRFSEAEKRVSDSYYLLFRGMHVNGKCHGDGWRPMTNTSESLGLRARGGRGHVGRRRGIPNTPRRRTIVHDARRLRHIRRPFRCRCLFV